MVAYGAVQVASLHYVLNLWKAQLHNGMHTDFGSVGTDSNPARAHCFVILSKTLHFHRDSLKPGDGDSVNLMPGVTL